MNLTIDAKLQAYIEAKVESGGYDSASEVVNEALRLLIERDEEKFRALKQFMQDRVEEADRGEVIPLNAALSEEIHRRGMERLAKLKRG